MDFSFCFRDNFTVSLVTGIDTTLADLLALDLHRYEDEVRSVVDRAVREVSMEKTLRELEATWATLELGKEEHARTGLTLLKASDELIATLEDNQVITCLPPPCGCYNQPIFLFRSNCKLWPVPSTLPI
jgi:hypothetical protein